MSDSQVNDIPLCACGRPLTIFWTNGLCVVCAHKDDEGMGLVIQMLKAPEIIYSNRERDRAIKYLYGLVTGER